MKRQASVGMLYLKTIIIASLLFAITHLTSCNTYKPCHVKKHYVDRSIRKAQSKPRNY